MQAQEKQQQALQLVEGSAGDVISMPAEFRALRASLHVCFSIARMLNFLSSVAVSDN